MESAGRLLEQSAGFLAGKPGAEAKLARIAALQKAARQARESLLLAQSRPATP